MVEKNYALMNPRPQTESPTQASSHSSTRSHTEPMNSPTVDRPKPPPPSDDIDVEAEETAKRHPREKDNSAEREEVILPPQPSSGNGFNQELLDALLQEEGNREELFPRLHNQRTDTTTPHSNTTTEQNNTSPPTNNNTTTFSLSESDPNSRLSLNENHDSEETTPKNKQEEHYTTTGDTSLHPHREEEKDYHLNQSVSRSRSNSIPTELMTEMEDVETHSSSVSNSNTLDHDEHHHEDNPISNMNEIPSSNIENINSSLGENAQKILMSPDMKQMFRAFENPSSNSDQEDENIRDLSWHDHQKEESENIENETENDKNDPNMNESHSSFDEDRNTHEYSTTSLPALRLSLLNSSSSSSSSSSSENENEREVEEEMDLESSSNSSSNNHNEDDESKDQSHASSINDNDESNTKSTEEENPSNQVHLSTPSYNHLKGLHSNESKTDKPNEHSIQSVASQQKVNGQDEKLNRASKSNSSGSSASEQADALDETIQWCTETGNELEKAQNEMQDNQKKIRREVVELESYFDTQIFDSNENKNDSHDLLKGFESLMQYHGQAQKLSQRCQETLQNPSLFEWEGKETSEKTKAQSILDNVYSIDEHTKGMRNLYKDVLNTDENNANSQDNQDEPASPFSRGNSKHRRRKRSEVVSALVASPQLEDIREKQKELANTISKLLEPADEDTITRTDSPKENGAIEKSRHQENLSFVYMDTGGCPYELRNK